MSNPITTQTVDGQTMALMPAAPGTCPLCAVAHVPAQPHNAQSLYYSMRFQMTHGRHPTWADAIAHCDDAVKGAWMRELTRMGAWTQPPTGTLPIAEPGGVPNPAAN